MVTLEYSVILHYNLTLIDNFIYHLAPIFYYWFTRDKSLLHLALILNVPDGHWPLYSGSMRAGGEAMI